MDVLIVIILFAIVAVAANADRLFNKNVSKKQRYIESAKDLAHTGVESVLGAVQTLTESEQEKKIRMAKEAIAIRNGDLYRFGSISNNDDDKIKKLLTVDPEFQKSLDIVGLSPNTWKTVGEKLFYIGLIKETSRDSKDYTKKNEEGLRKCIIKGDDEILKNEKEAFYLKKGLAYFNISEDEWIKYGDSVLDMYNIYDQSDLRKYGYKVAIMPMQNNYHLF